MVKGNVVAVHPPVRVKAEVQGQVRDGAVVKGATSVVGDVTQTKRRTRKTTRRLSNSIGEATIAKETIKM